MPDVSIGFAILVIGLLWMIPLLRLVALAVAFWFIILFLTNPAYHQHGW